MRPRQFGLRSSMLVVAIAASFLVIVRSFHASIDSAPGSRTTVVSIDLFSIFVAFVVLIVALMLFSKAQK
jgi:hypothetical protein